MIEVIRNSIIRGLETTPNSYKTREQNLLEIQAINALNEYHLVINGAASYESLGYGIAGGGVDEFKMLEHLLISQEIEQARKDKK